MNQPLIQKLTKILYKKISILIVFLTLGCIHKDPLSKIDSEVLQIENSLVKAIIVQGDSINHYSIQERMKYHNVPGLGIAVVKDGKIHWVKSYGYANISDSIKVNSNTLFQAGSISKPLAALACLKLMEDKKVNLDVDVNEYLKNWKIESNGFLDKEKVTLRRLLTHTAGVTVHGFPGYRQTDSLPSIIDILEGNGNTAKVHVNTIPDSIWRYSGGGYTIMEKVVEDVSGLPLEQFMEKYFFNPLQMHNSTFEQPLPPEYHNNVSAAYDSQGVVIEGLWHNYPEQAAAGLWTTPTDLGKYCIAIQKILLGQSESVLSKGTVEMMLTKHKNNWGLGPSLVWEGDSLRFQHGGKNAGFTNRMIAFAHSGNAVIIMTNADNGGALAGEIMRSISKFYDWGIANPQEISIIDLSEEELMRFEGKYVLMNNNEEGNYIIEIIRDRNKLIVHNPNNNQQDELYSISSTEFIDLEDGDQMEFFSDSNSIKFRWNNRFHFAKISNE